MASLGNLVRRIAAKVLVKTKLCSRILIQRNGYQLRFHPSSFSAGLWVHPEYGLRDEAFLRSYLRIGDTYVDIGANIGNLALTAAQIAGAVIAVEAHPRTFRFLQENIALNRCPNVTLLNVAVGEAEGRLSFSDVQDDDKNHILDQPGGISVPVIPLDSLRLEKIDLLKIDVEGFEKFVLLGAQQTLQRTACVYFESYAPQYERYGYSGGDVYRLLANAGFSLYRPGAPRPTPVALEHVSEHCENLLAVRDMADFARRTGSATASA